MTMVAHRLELNFLCLYKFLQKKGIFI